MKPDIVRNDAGLSPELRFLWDYLFGRDESLPVSFDELRLNMGIGNLDIRYCIGCLSRRGLITVHKIWYEEPQKTNYISYSTN